MNSIKKYTALIITRIYFADMNAIINAFVMLLHKHSFTQESKKDFEYNV